MSAPLLVLVAAPASHADRLAHALVEARVAACVSQLPGARSVYRWQGAVETAEETLLLIKTTAATFETLRTQVLALHPYELPEILAVPISAGHTPYLQWLAQETLAPFE